jgi:hypothetical protein
MDQLPLKPQSCWTLIYEVVQRSRIGEKNDASQGQNQALTQHASTLKLCCSAPTKSYVVAENTQSNFVNHNKKFFGVWPLIVFTFEPESAKNFLPACIRMHVIRVSQVVGQQGCEGVPEIQR